MTRRLGWGLVGALTGALVMTTQSAFGLTTWGASSTLSAADLNDNFTELNDAITALQGEVDALKSRRGEEPFNQAGANNPGTVPLNGLTAEPGHTYLVVVQPQAYGTGNTRGSVWIVQRTNNQTLCAATEISGTQLGTGSNNTTVTCNAGTGTVSVNDGGGIAQTTITWMEI